MNMLVKKDDIVKVISSNEVCWFEGMPKDEIVHYCDLDLKCDITKWGGILAIHDKTKYDLFMEKVKHDLSFCASHLYSAIILFTNVKNVKNLKKHYIDQIYNYVCLYSEIDEMHKEVCNDLKNANKFFIVNANNILMNLMDLESYKSYQKLAHLLMNSKFITFAGKHQIKNQKMAKNCLDECKSECEEISKKHEEYIEYVKKNVLGPGVIPSIDFDDPLHFVKQ